MKFTPVIIALVVTSQLALGATTKKIKKITYEDGTTSTSIVYPKAVDQNRFVRRIIPEIGVVIGDVTTKTSSTRTGLNVGAVTDLLGTKEMVLETGLLYRQLGTSDNGATIALNYLTVPVSAKYYFFGQQATGPYAKAGVTPGINVAASATDSSGNNSTSISNQISTFDFGFILAAGGKFNVGSQLSIIAEAYYNRGLVNVLSAAPGQPALPFSTNTIGYGVSTGLSVDL